MDHSLADPTAPFPGELPSPPPDTEDPETFLVWTRAHFEHPVLSCSFGGTGIVLVHMVARLGLDIPVAFLDTGFLFPETLATRRAFVERYGVRVIDLPPDPEASRHAPDLYRVDPDLCCELRKVRPMARLLEGCDAWITGLRRDQGGRRAEVRPVEIHRLPGGATVAKVNPLAHWTKADAWRYIVAHGLPYNPLLDRGYASLGCAPCTRPVASGAPERSGRWAGSGKTECGLHTFTQQVVEEPRRNGRCDAE